MQREFLQEKSLNRFVGNAEKSLDVDLSAKSRLIPHSTAVDVLGLYDLYTRERDDCESYRMVFTVNPICTNVLYNAITEPVFKEGSYSAVCLTLSGVSRTDSRYFPEGTMGESGNVVDQVYAVRNTEFSHERIGNFKYHCGYDIFNNHLLRSNEFEHVMKDDSPEESENRVQFNTIFDFAVDYSGRTLMRSIDDADGPVTGFTLEKIRLYQLDTIRSFNTAFYYGLKAVDGWYGFQNSGYINLPNGKLEEKDIFINRVLNNEAPCGFIDLYPDRSLFSFLPKVNRYKRRLERNWDCSMVYPYKNDFDMFNKVMLGITDDNKWDELGNKCKPNAVRILEARLVYNNVGDEMIEMHTMLRHTLLPGDVIRIYYRESAEGTNNEIFRYPVPVRVVSIGDVNGDDLNRVFTIKLFDISTFCGVGENKDGKFFGKRESDGSVNTPFDFFFRKIINGCDCRYYFRKFKEIRYNEYVQCDEEETERLAPEATKVIKEPTIITDDSPAVIKLGNDIFKLVSRPLDYSQNKLAFATNIYGDRVGQVIFNDDICISGLRDNLRRPLSEVYLMLVKTNRGHKEWYNSGITSANTVEYSHCFGEITSGLDLPAHKDSTEYNVRKLHNVFSAQCIANYAEGLKTILSGAPEGNYSGTPTPIESGITIDSHKDFYGDIVEFDRSNFRETVIEKVYYRFNTAQRECLTTYVKGTKKDVFYNLHYDDLMGDIYDVV